MTCASLHVYVSEKKIVMHRNSDNHFIDEELEERETVLAVARTFNWIGGPKELCLVVGR